MKRTTLFLSVLILMLLTSAVLALAPPPGLEINWWVMGGGEEPRHSGALQISATIGQPAIGHSASGPLDLSWGYWGEQKLRVYQPLILK